MNAEAVIALRERFRNEGTTDGMNEEEVLALMLSYIKSPEAAASLSPLLLEEYATLNNLLKTPPDRLVKNKLIDEQSAVFLSLFYQLENSVLLHKNDRLKQLKTVEERKEYARNILYLKQQECFLVISLDKKNKVLGKEIVAAGTVNHSYVEPRLVIETLFENGADRAIFAHNHPCGKAEPSYPDIRLTEVLQKQLNAAGVTLVDHIIVGESEVLSMRCDTDKVIFRELE